MFYSPFFFLGKIIKQFLFPRKKRNFSQWRKRGIPAKIGKVASHFALTLWVSRKNTFIGCQIKECIDADNISWRISWLTFAYTSGFFMGGLHSFVQDVFTITFNPLYPRKKFKLFNSSRAWISSNALPLEGIFIFKILGKSREKIIKWYNSALKKKKFPVEWLTALLFH